MLNLVWRLVWRMVLLFLLVVLVLNLIWPAFHRTVPQAEQQRLRAVEYQAGQPGTERVLCIDDNEEALLWRLRLIDAATQSLVVCTFDFRADESGTDLMAALYRAAERGVEIRILVDGIYQLLFLDHSDTFQALCAHPRVEARYYNPPTLKNLGRVNYRMHDKYILVDDTLYLLGGRNTNDIFLGDYQEGKNIDREILVYECVPGKGESFLALQAYFEQIWAEPSVQRVRPDPNGSPEAEYAMLEERYQGLCERWPQLTGYDRWQQDTLPANKITLLTNGTQAARKQPLMLAALQALMEEGKDIIIQTPYVICNRAMYQVLEQVSANAEVSILLNAVERGSNPWGCTDYLNNKKKIQATGVVLYELMNQQAAVHTKTIVVDDRISVVGSYNLDMRSTYLDTELMLVIDSAPLNRHIRGMDAVYQQRSLQVLPDGTETAGAEYLPRQLSWQKKLYYAVLRVIILPFRHLL